MLLPLLLPRLLLLPKLAVAAAADDDDDLVIFFIIITVFNQLLITTSCVFSLLPLSLHLSPGSGSTREVLKTWRCQIKGATEIAFGCRRAPPHHKRKYEIQNKKRSGRNA